MKCYPIKDSYISLFQGRESVLLTLLKENSIQLDVILERIDICDFSMRCLRFFSSCEYELKQNTIVYTNTIDKKKQYCALHNHCLSLSSLKGFSPFIERYFHTCFLCDEDFAKGEWFSYHLTKKNE